MSETFLEVSESLFSSTFAFLMVSLASQKRRPFNADFKLAGKTQLKPIQEYMGDTPILSNCCLVRNPWPKPTVCWRIVMNEKSTDGSPFFVMFPSDRIPKATNPLMRQKFPSCSSSFKLIPANSGNVLKLLVYTTLSLKFLNIVTLCTRCGPKVPGLRQ